MCYAEAAGIQKHGVSGKCSNMEPGECTLSTLVHSTTCPDMPRVESHSWPRSMTHATLANLTHLTPSNENTQTRTLLLHIPQE